MVKTLNFARVSFWFVQNWRDTRWLQVSTAQHTRCYCFWRVNQFARANLAKKTPKQHTAIVHRRLYRKPEAWKPIHESQKKLHQYAVCTSKDLLVGISWFRKKMSLKFCIPGNALTARGCWYQHAPKTIQKLPKSIVNMAIVEGLQYPY